MVLIIDNYDSFTYNLVQMVGCVNPDIKIIRNDELTVSEIEEMNPSHIIISPGPGYPKDAGACINVSKTLGKIIPTLGVCLGHQAICEAFGSEICLADKLMHGKQSDVHIANGSAIFKGLPPIIKGARYHSLIAKRDTLPDELLVIAEDINGEVMGVKHRDFELYGLQFHPESILTVGSDLIIKNFLSIGGEGL